MSTTNSVSSKQSFNDHPLHIKILVFLTFPLYAGIRLAGRLIWEGCKKTFNLIEGVCIAAGKVWDLCGQIYNILAPKLYSVFGAILIEPMKKYIINPVVSLLRVMYDKTVQVCKACYYTFKDVGTAVTNACKSIWA